MNLKAFLILFCGAMALFSCTQETQRLVTDRYSDGSDQRVLFFKGDTTNLVQEVTFYPSGDTLSSIFYEKDGTTKSMENQYYENGNFRMLGQYKNGKRLGVWKAFFPDGKLQSIRNYNAEGKEEGVSQVYKQEGKYYYLFLSGYFKDGEKRGTWKFYNRNGDVIQTKNH